MAKTKKKSQLGEQTKRKINIESFRAQLDNLKEKGQGNYSPKIGRQMKKLNKKISQEEKKQSKHKEN